MKRLLLSGMMLAALVRIAAGQPLASYTNNSPFVGLGPQIDATNFINNAEFDVTVPSGVGARPFDFTDTLFFTNKSLMACNLGFHFDNVTTVNNISTRRFANTFGNNNLGQIYAGSSSASPDSFSPLFGPPVPEIIVNATNVVSTGVMDVDVTGTISVVGSALNLARSTFHVEGFDTFANTAGGSDALGGSQITDIGIFDSLYGLGLQTNVLSAGNFALPFPSSPSSLATNLLGTQTSLIVSPEGAEIFVWTNSIDNSNFSVQVVIINTNLPGVSTDVRFAGESGGVEFGIPTVQWSAIVTNSVGKAIATNFLYLQDTFGSHPTNTMVTNGFTFSGVPKFAPYNFALTRAFSGFSNLPTANTVGLVGLFNRAFPATNAYAAYEVNLLPVAFAPDITALATPITNLPGRVLLTATNAGSWLDLSRSAITGPNYLSISATNHFVGSTGANIVAPNMDINVGTTNGNLLISGLVAPSVPRFDGTIDMYSARWTNLVTNVVVSGTNVSTNTVTNFFHIFIVNSGLAPTSPVIVQNFSVRSTNVTISDIISITNSMRINAANLTITTNAAGAPNPTGEILLLNTNILWSVSAPNLQNLTNWGFIDGTVEGLGNAVDFFDTGGAPYKSWVNHGDVIGDEITINANYLENSSNGVVDLSLEGTELGIEPTGILESAGGNINVQATAAFLEGGELFTPADINITTGSLIISNHVLQASGVINLNLTNSVADGGTSSSNRWFPGNGINLLLRPTTGDLLGTTVTLTAQPNEEIDNTWDGQDLGASAAGFVNNAALGHLILNAADANGAFLFQGLDSVNKYALYVDLIELENGATNRQVQDGLETFTAFDLPPNVTIYFADAVFAGNDISEKLNGSFGLNGTNGGKLIWVPSFAGFFSSTNITYPNGITYQFNRALRLSPDISSDGSTPNFATAFPFNVNLSAVRSNTVPPVSTLSWYSPGLATNQVRVYTNLASTNFTVLTTMTNGVSGAQLSAQDIGRTNGTIFYQVLISPAKP